MQVQRRPAVPFTAVMSEQMTPLPVQGHHWQALMSASANSDSTSVALSSRGARNACCQQHQHATAADIRRAGRHAAHGFYDICKKATEHLSSPRGKAHPSKDQRPQVSVTVASNCGRACKGLLMVSTCLGIHPFLNRRSPQWNSCSSCQLCCCPCH